MKIMSVSIIIDSTAKVIKRFTFLILLALLGTIVFSLVIQFEPKETVLLKIGFMCLIGIFLTGALYLFTERKSFTKVKQHLFVGLITIPILIFYFYNFNSEPEDGIRLAFLVITTFLIIMLSYPYGVSSQKDFWYFNKVLFLRILVSGLFTFALFGGLSLALLAVNKLFGVEISVKAYGHLFIWLTGIFSIFFFLTGIPEDLEAFSVKKDYPKSLKMFTQYILIPLAFLYMVILYVYAITILFKWELPRGMVTSLTLVYSAIGILSVLFVFPLIESITNRWFKLFQTWFYRLIFPLLFLMGFAIYQRVSDYGITIDRYLSIVATLWLFCIALYFVFFAKKNIKLIPLSLIIIGFLISVGPQSAFNISENSQLDRLNKLIGKYQLLDKENLDKTIIVNDKDYHNFTSITYYLIDFHKPDKLYEILHKRSKIPFDKIKKMGHYSATNLLKIKATDNENEYRCSFSRNNNNYETFSVSGYDKFFEYEFSENAEYVDGEIKTNEFYTKIDVKKPALNFILKIGSKDTLRLDLSKLVQLSLHNEHFDFKDIQSFTTENNEIIIKFIPEYCNGNSKKIEYLNGFVFYKLKK